MRWELQAHGLHWDRVVLDGGAAMQAACDAVTPEVLLQGDSWHERFDCGKVQARLQRARTQLEQRTPAARRAALPPVNAAARRVAEGTRYLTAELRRLLAVVVLDQRGLVTATQRQAES